MVAKVQSRRVAYKRGSKDYTQLENQERAINEYISQHESSNWEMVEEHVSGRKMTGPGFQQLWDDVLAGKIAEIVVFSIDRLGRNVKQGLSFIDDCTKMNTKIVFLREKHLDVNTPMGRFGWMQHMAWAELEASLISTRTAEGLFTQKHRCIKCKYYDLDNRKEGNFKCLKCGSTEPCFKGGSKEGSSWMTEKVAKKVKEILRLFDAKVPRYQIAKLVKLDERTVAKIVNNRHNLPAPRERTWDQ